MLAVLSHHVSVESTTCFDVSPGAQLARSLARRGGSSNTFYGRADPIRPGRSSAPAARVAGGVTGGLAEMDGGGTMV